MKLLLVGVIVRVVFIKIGLNPDLVIYGKALGNGFAISAVIGKFGYCTRYICYIISYFSNVVLAEVGSNLQSKIKRTFFKFISKSSN